MVWNRPIPTTNFQTALNFRDINRVPPAGLDSRVFRFPGTCFWQIHRSPFPCLFNAVSYLSAIVSTTNPHQTMGFSMFFCPNYIITIAPINFLRIQLFGGGGSYKFEKNQFGRVGTPPPAARNVFGPPPATSRHGRSRQGDQEGGGWVPMPTTNCPNKWCLILLMKMAKCATLQPRRRQLLLMRLVTSLQSPPPPIPGSPQIQPRRFHHCTLSFLPSMPILALQN